MSIRASAFSHIPNIRCSAEASFRTPFGTYRSVHIGYCQPTRTDESLQRDHVHAIRLEFDQIVDDSAGQQLRATVELA